MENLGEQKIFDGRVSWKNVVVAGKYVNSICQRQMIGF